jgi:hypothetical protein
MVRRAKDENAQRFYEHYGFTLLAGETHRLCLPIATKYIHSRDRLANKQQARDGLREYME